MERKKLSLAVTTLAGIVAISGYLLAQDPETSPKALTIEADSRPIERVGGSHPTSYAPMLEEARRSVVSVYTSEVVRYVNRSGSIHDLLRRQFQGYGPNDVEERSVPQGVGSGVIISPDGYILTNNHVVVDQRGGDADEIIVKLSDETELPAKLIGRDPKSDVAVIKVEGVNLPTAKIADSEQTKVGDIVFAIGNPLGVGLTVTSGIISATGRSIGIYGKDGYEDFIQTDAAINQGNSGGALVDIEGRLIGINSAIMSQSGGSVGIGFAIPTNLATSIAEQLTQSGTVKRGKIGVNITDLDPRVAEAMGVPGTKGVLIEQLEEGLPAEKAGLKHGDIITQINHKKIKDVQDLRLEISKTAPGDTLIVTALRNGEASDYEIEVYDTSKISSIGKELLPGIVAAPIDQSVRLAYDLSRNVRGLIITSADQDSPFAKYLLPGVCILQINKREIETVEQARQLLRSRGSNLFYVYQDGRTQYFALRLN